MEEGGIRHELSNDATFNVIGKKKCLDQTKGSNPPAVLVIYAGIRPQEDMPKLASDGTAEYG